MEENQPKTGKYALNFGALLAIVSITFSLMLYFMEMHYERSWGLTIVNAVIMISIVVLGISQFKKANGGFLTLTEALKVGLGIALIAGILGVLYQFVFTNYIEPDFMLNTMEMQKREMLAKNPNMTQEQIDGAMEMMETFSNPALGAAIGIVVSLFFGFIISLFSGLIMKKQKPEH